MRKILIAALALIAASVAAPASAMDLSPSAALGNPALQTPAGRRHLCRIHLEAEGYPYSYLQRRGSRGLVGACARDLWRKWKHPQSV
jgi:hypothetical protein